MRLEDIAKEIGEFGKDFRNKLKESTTDYRGTQENYNSNRRKAAVGIASGIIIYPIIPLVSLGALTYGGIKAYQAYKDKRNRRKNERRYTVWKTEK